MKKGIKFLVLSLTLLLPILFFLFLKNFGENKYEIPLYYQEKADSVNITGCLQFDIPHSVDFKTYIGKSRQVQNQITVVNPIFDECLDCPPNLNEVKRVSQRHDDVLIQNIYSEMVTRVDNKQTNTASNWLTTLVGFPELIKIVKCELIIEVPFDTSIDWMKANGQLVLLDTQNRIRGYYKKSDREDIDRLITEISILKREADGE